MSKLTSDAKFEDGDIKASLAALTFILSSAAKHSVDSPSLNNELQQLGLPKGASSNSILHIINNNIDSVVLLSVHFHFASVQYMCVHIYNVKYRISLIRAPTFY